MTEHESHCTSEFAGSQQFTTAIKYKNTCGEFMNGQMNEWMDMKQRGKQKNKQTNKCMLAYTCHELCYDKAWPQH